MKKTIKFYTAKEIQLIKQEIKNGIPIPEIGKRFALEFKRPVSGITAKVYSLSKTIIKPTIKTPTIANPINIEGVSIPQGLVWEGNGDIKLYKDHFRVYFK